MNVQEVHTDDYAVTVRIEEGQYMGTKVRLPYEDVCKYVGIE